MKEPVGIDAGHGYTKAMRLNGARVLFPSLICPAPATVDLGEFGTQPPLTQINDKLYLVGEAARRHATPLWDRNKAADEDTARDLNRQNIPQRMRARPSRILTHEHTTLTAADGLVR